MSNGFVPLALALVVIIVLVCLGLTIYVLLKPRTSSAWRLFYFDLSRYMIHIFICMPVIGPVSRYAASLIFNPQNTKSRIYINRQIR